MTITSIDTPIDRLSVSKLLSIVIIAALVTFALFAVMQKLISNTDLGTKPQASSPILVFMQNIEELPLITKTRKLKPIKPLPIPEHVSRIEQQPPNPKALISKYVPEVGIGKQELTLATQFGSGDSQARPIVRMEPKYPLDAARNGIEGWVKLLFSIDSLGQVANIQVLDSEPSRVFDHEAKRALAKWKYKPQVIGGKPQAQDGLVVVLDFKLQQ